MKISMSSTTAHIGGFNSNGGELAAVLHLSGAQNKSSLTQYLVLLGTILVFNLKVLKLHTQISPLDADLIGNHGVPPSILLGPKLAL
jgi:hypothetical protein